MTFDVSSAGAFGGILHVNLVCLETKYWSEETVFWNSVLELQTHTIYK
jgi:hypothetical protein